MNESTFKSELLRQNGRSAVDEEVSRLHGIIAAEQRRVRRLAFWTIAVWAVWILMISLGLVVPMVLYTRARTIPPPPNSTTMPMTAPPSDHRVGGGQTAVGMFLGLLIVGAFLGLPVAGVVLALMLIVTRRSASLNQVKASLAAIDAQLRLLGAGHTPGPGGAKQ